jgi:hypothetical protein
MKKMRNIDPFNGWMNDFELHQTNEWLNKIILLYITMINE